VTVDTGFKKQKIDCVVMDTLFQQKKIRLFCVHPKLRTFTFAFAIIIIFIIFFIHLLRISSDELFPQFRVYHPCGNLYNSHFYWQKNEAPIIFDFASSLTPRGFIPRNSIPVPIFIITKDRLCSLRETLRSIYRGIRSPFEIVIHDDGSTYQPTLDFLNELESHGVQVFRNSINVQPESSKEEHLEVVRNLKLNLVSHSINTYMSNIKSEFKPKYYVVTDPDISVQNRRELFSKVFSNTFSKSSLAIFPIRLNRVVLKDC